jgi:hypothetical protein
MLSEGVKKKPLGAEYRKRRAEREHELEDLKIYESAEIFYINKYRE